MEELKDMLDGTIKGFIASIDKYGHLTDGLQQVTAQVNVGVASLGQTATSIKEGQEAAARVSASLSEQVESMKGVIQNHGEVWRRISDSMVEYERYSARSKATRGKCSARSPVTFETFSDATETHFLQPGPVRGLPRLTGNRPPVRFHQGAVGAARRPARGSGRLESRVTGKGIDHGRRENPVLPLEFLHRSHDIDDARPGGPQVSWTSCVWPWRR